MEWPACKKKTEKFWLAAGAASLLLHRLSEGSPDGHALLLYEIVMIALSFPAGPIAMLFIAIALGGPSDDANLSWLLDWSTLLFIGYIQWFWLVPELRQNSQLITLNLSRTPPAAVADETAPPREIQTTHPAPPLPETVALPAAAAAAAPHIFDARAFLPPLSEFDEAGLTALDKVLRAYDSTSTPTHPDSDPLLSPAR